MGDRAGTGAGGSRRLHLPAGSAASGPWALALTPERAGWSFASLRVLALARGGSQRFPSGEEELLVLSLEGAGLVSVPGHDQPLLGRPGVFTGPSDLVYVPRDSEVVLSSELGGRFAVAGARARRRLPFAYRSAGEVPVEVRGAGSCSRRVVNYCMGHDLEADRLLVCEVVTPSGNWSSYPPHRHDRTGPGEAELEEIYYFRVAPGASGAPGLAYQRVYGTRERPIDLLAEVRDGDVVLVPHGFHGPSMSAPGYDLYYLNVMAGPGERAWLATDDPEHAWVRESWAGQAVDPRLLAAPSEPGPAGTRAGAAR